MDDRTMVRRGNAEQSFFLPAKSGWPQLDSFFFC